MRSTTRLAAVLVLALIVATPGFSQYPIGAVGFYLSTNLGHTAGSFCWWFNCTPATVNVTAGEVVTLRISGEWQAPFLLGSASTATSCQSFPNIYHSLVLDMPAVIVDTGMLALTSPVLACPNGYWTITATVPAGIPLGTTIPLQALTFGAGNVPALTGAIIVTIT